MLDEQYLVHGLNGLSRAAERDHFRDGHLAASVIAAWYLCRENHLDGKVEDVIREIIDGELLGDDLFAPVPDESADPALLPELERAVVRAGGTCREAGHDIIFAAAALKTFRFLPETVTPARINGICRLIDSFSKTQDILLDAQDAIPRPEDPACMADFIMREFLRTVELYAGFGQGWAGHLLTIGHAVIELHAMGYADMAAMARLAYAKYIKTMRGGPKPLDGTIPEHPPSPWTPLDYEYWRNAGPVRPGLGHRFKYPYSFYKLLGYLADDALRQRCLAESYRIF